MAGPLAATKGEAVLKFFEKNGPSTRKEAADAVGCTVARVGEVIRAAGNFKKLEDGRWAVAQRGRRRAKR